MKCEWCGKDAEVDDQTTKQDVVDLLGWHYTLDPKTYKEITHVFCCGKCAVSFVIIMGTDKNA